MHKVEDVKLQRSVLSVLLYGSETWKTTKSLQDKIQVSTNHCLRRMLNVKVEGQENQKRNSGVSKLIYYPPDMKLHLGTC